MRQNPLNILIIGAGMYVCGRETGAYGTVLPAICEWSRKNKVGKLYVAGRSPEGVRDAKKKCDGLQRKINARVFVEYMPRGTKIKNDCYKDAMRRITKPCACIVAVPDHLHKKVATAAIENGMHTLVVKPLAPTVREVKTLVSVQDANQVYCAVEFHKRFDCANLMLRDVMREKKIGVPLYLTVEYSQRKSMPVKVFKKWVSKTNIFQYLGIHYVDIVYFVTGARPRRAMAIGQKKWLVSKGIDTYDSIQAVIEWGMPDGTTFGSIILTNWIDPESTSAASDQTIKVIGTRGRFESDQKKRGVMLVTDEDGIEEPNPYFCMSYGPEGNAIYRGYGVESIKQFLDDVVSVETSRVSIEELEGKRPTFKQSVVPTAVLEAVNESLKRGGEWVTVSEL